MSTKAFVTAQKTPLAPIRALGAVCARNYLSRLSLSTSLGSAKDFNDVVALEACRLATSPTFLQRTLLPKIGSRSPCDRPLEEAGRDRHSHRRAGIGACL